MLLAVIWLTVMCLGTCFLAVFGRHVAGLLEKWASEPGRNTRALTGRSG